jgi:hypothetical protein
MEILNKAIKKLFPQSRLLWDSSNGTAIRTEKGYRAKPKVAKGSGARKLTEAEDNAKGRAIRRRTNRALRGWLPYAQR